jgi:hypothetical protein
MQNADLLVIKQVGHIFTTRSYRVKETEHNLRIGIQASCCERCKEPACSIKVRKILGQVSDYQLSNKGYAPCS